MRRYSRKFLEKHPHLRGKDIETTRKACARFRHMPVSVMNFVEGTRFTVGKHDRQGAPYRHLLHLRAGASPSPWRPWGSTAQAGGCDHRLSRRRPQLLGLHVRSGQGDQGSGPLSADRTQSGGDYFNDPEFQQEFQQWLNGIWHERTRPWISCWRTRRSKTLMPNLLPGPWCCSSAPA